MKLKLLLAATAMASIAVPASAAVIVLDFEKVNATYPSTNYANVQNFYNGGTSSQGTSGTNYGVDFSANALAICLNSTTQFCSNTSRGGLAPGSAEGGLFFLDGAQTFMNVAAGFTTGFSFNYVSASQPGSVSAYSGLNGTGTLLGTLNLAPNAGSCPGYSAGFCPFSAAGLAFTGTAMSISFAGVANQIVFDDVTFGSEIVGGAVPEAATWMMMLAGFGIVGGAMRRRQRTSVSFA